LLFFGLMDAALGTTTTTGLESAEKSS